MLVISSATVISMSCKTHAGNASRELAHLHYNDSSSNGKVNRPAGAICIDGSQLEGGGQILRYSVALASITGQPIYVENIRAGRKNTGLSPQHLTGLRLVESISSGTLQGGAVRSAAISFVPGRMTAGSYTADTKTAGSCTLMVQQALPCLLFVKQPAESAVCTLTLRGGTDATHAPPSGYLQHVLLPLLQQQLGPAGLSLNLNLVCRGFYPKGGGEMVLEVCSLPPCQTLPAINLTDRGHVTRIDGYAFTAGKLRHDIGRRTATSCTNAIKQALKNQTTVFGRQVAAAAAAAAAAAGDAVLHNSSTSSTDVGSPVVPSVVVNIQAVQEPPDKAYGDGGGIVLVATTSTGCLLGASALAERGVSAEAVGTMAARDLVEVLQSGAAVDDWMQDQLIIFMALAQGSSSILCNELTLHTRTAISVVQQLLPQAQFTVSTLSAATPELKDQPLYLIRCVGAGMHVQRL